MTTIKLGSLVGLAFPFAFAALGVSAALAGALLAAWTIC